MAMVTCFKLQEDGVGVARAAQIFVQGWVDVRAGRIHIAVSLLSSTFAKAPV